jgi:hypothetical protein
VNMYKNVFYIMWFSELISHIYKPTTCSHFEPGLLMPHFLTGSSLDLQLFIRESHPLYRFPNWVFDTIAEM